MYQALLKYSREVQERHGYTEIAAPLVNNKKLWLISGHWAHYVNNMFMVPGVSGWLKADAEIPGVLENLNEPAEEPKNIKILAKSVIYNREQDDTMAAKPMNCPNAMMTYKRTNHSYKELPIRYSEYDVLHRKEKSGQMNGLMNPNDSSNKYIAVMKALLSSPDKKHIIFTNNNVNIKLTALHTML